MLSPRLSARLTRYPAPYPCVMDRGEPPSAHCCPPAPTTPLPPACAPIASERGGRGADAQGQEAREEPQAPE